MSKDFCYCNNMQCDISKDCKRFWGNSTCKPGETVWMSRCKGGKDCQMFVKLKEVDAK